MAPSIPFAQGMTDVFGPKVAAKGTIVFNIGVVASDGKVRELGPRNAGL